MVLMSGAKSTPYHKKPQSLVAAIAGLAIAVAAGYFGLQPSQDSPEQAPATSAIRPHEGECPVESLPPQVKDTIADITAGGPFDYPDNDGVRFGNYEGHLPRKDRNFYREYTVETPGLRHRGERRIITGGGSKTSPQQWYYTDDHYESFCEIPNAH
ncbi:guanyl-specific ribonuclease [Corynebacterium diphtheriae]|uniref:ribonuclease domain-containing protein n=1 Tax=Corynebacterium diphtheriae TaxID=1717 RepID=UPI0005A1334B|nr:ribonuclease domain-containing protein [Corynebacterium diphtheriae]MCM0016307.1 ribonuclease [Corynebacterium diphtheriae bv. mitis]MCM0026015.1 ribonuclease [Corynebacterium diphtheriae bv. mitis]MCM0029478.1 ribonuclease [Corynebacterium diphtheriae bv. mitis]MCM0037229.1 ribonuclease [Corynebacterium diphtheriae bv. mitis]MCM0039381.1 ribonuclease [Corynebacterium diphtheriae bv. mitis]